MPITTTTTLASSTLPVAGASTATLTEGELYVRYSLFGGVPVFECRGQTARDGTIYLTPETWLAWVREGFDLIIEPDAAAPTLLVRLTDTSGRALLTTDGEPTPIAATARLRVRLLFADSTGMSFKIALDGAGAVDIDLGDVGTQLRPPPPKLPPDPPQPN